MGNETTKTSLTLLLCALAALAGRAEAADVVRLRVGAAPAAMAPSAAPLVSPSLLGPAPILGLSQSLTQTAFLEAPPAPSVDSAAPARVAAAYASNPSLNAIRNEDPKNTAARSAALDYAFEKRSGSAAEPEGVVGKPSRPATLQAAAPRPSKTAGAAGRITSSTPDKKPAAEPSQSEENWARLRYEISHVLFNRVTLGLSIMLGLVMATSPEKLTLLDVAITVGAVLAHLAVVIVIFYFAGKSLADSARKEVKELSALLEGKKPELLNIPGVKSIAAKPAHGWPDDLHLAYGVIIVDHIGPDNYYLLPKEDHSAWINNPEGFDRLGSIDGWPVGIKIVP